ncbi:GNAT family N-acetyltransferase [Clostridium sp. LS]|uniref:GNAT family N-acetyltransferase n=1 Tax=unclassified Clostridium TaxID=2614128 RepID=UPI0005511F39
MKYQELTMEHIKEISEIYVNSFNSEPWNDKWTIESASKRISQMINCEGFYGLVAYEEDRMVGMILGNHEYYYDAMLFQIKEFCVDSRIKGSGIGSELLDEFMARLRIKGINRIILLTLKSNQTEGFYKKHGFKIFDDMILMGKDI